MAQPIDADVAAFAQKLQLRECPAQHMVLVDEQERESAALLLDEPGCGGAPLPFHISSTDGSDNRVAEDARVCD